MAAVAVAASAAAKEPDIAGTFADDGTTIVKVEHGPAGAVSLRALFALEFDPRAARLLHERTAEIRIVEGPVSLTVLALDAEGAVAWQRDWRLGDGYARNDGRVMLRLRSDRHGRDEFVLNLEAVTEHRLLQVELQRLTPTLLGPMLAPLGTWVFPRLADAPRPAGAILSFPTGAKGG